MTELPRKYATVAETLQLPETETLDIGATLGAPAADWRDTLRSSLPHLPLGTDQGAQFRIASVLGRGGMGVVHLAFQPALGRHVALKTVPTERASRDAENALLQEARVMGLVEHPNVVPVHIIGQDDDGRPLIVMKRIEGTTWDRYLDRREELDADDPLEFNLRVLTSVCQAVSFAHSRGILHRDIKPENVMIGKFGEVYLLDWGLAVTLDADVPFVPLAADQQGVVGTPAYIAPEMTVGDGTKLSEQTDVFLLGAMLYHIVTGEPPNRGKSLFDVLACAYEGRPRPYAEDVPWELREICERAMALEPAERFGSAQELRDAVEGALGHRASIILMTEAQDAHAAMVEAMADDDGESVHRLFGESRFGFMSSLRIWAENSQARSGLNTCLRQMIDYELEHENPSVARGLAAQLEPVDREVEARVEEVAKALASRARRFEKLAYDYDADVGIMDKRWVAALIGGMFLVPLFLQPLVKDVEVPRALHFITTDAGLLFANSWGLAFVPVLAVVAWRTFTHYFDHKASRLFAEALIVMFVLGYGARLSSFLTDVPLHAGMGAECAVFAAVLLTMGLAVDRRLFLSGVIFAITAAIEFVITEHMLTVYCIGSAAACLAFVFGDYARGRIPGMRGSWEDSFGRRPDGDT